MVFKSIADTEADKNVLQNFLDNAGGSLTTFRYFKSRPLEAIRPHVLTCLLFVDDTPVGYGHLDPENEVVWLGICISESVSGKGYGFRMMQHLIDFAKEKGIAEIKLKVDADNQRAFRMYEKCGFEVLVHEPGSFYIMKRVI